MGFDEGLEVRKSVLGTAHVERSQTATTPFTADFQHYITENVCGDIWTRPGLDPRTRSMLTIAMLAAIGAHDELKLHIRATRNTGVTKDEVKEILLQVGAYAGVPAANTAFRIAAEIYAELEA